MAKKRRTREEKIKTSYRLKDFSLNVKEIREKRDFEGFGYLSSSFVKKDLIKTMVFSLVIVGIELYLASVL